MPFSIQTTQAARFKNHKRKQLKPKRGTKSNSPAPISCGFLDTASPSESNESPKNTRTAKVHDTNEDLEDMIFLLCFTVLSFRYAILNCCKWYFRVSLKNHFCPYPFSFAVVMEAMSFLRIAPHLLESVLYVLSSIEPTLNSISSQ